MLDEKRIKEAKSNVERYLRDNMLKRVSVKEPAIMKILMNNCKESLNVAEFIFNNRVSNLWTIVSSYYAMYYIANAVLYQFSYKLGHEVSHKVTADALIAYIRGKLKESFIEDYEEAKEEALELSGNKADMLLEEFDFEREKRSKFQYSTSEIALRSKAATSLERAKRFVFEMEKLLVG